MSSMSGELNVSSTEESRLGLLYLARREAAADGIVAVLHDTIVAPLEVEELIDFPKNLPPFGYDN